MKRVLILAAVFSFAVTVTAAEEPKKGFATAEDAKKAWIPFAPKEESFELLFPGEPHGSSVKEKNVSVYLMQVKQAGGNAVLTCSVMDFPKDSDFSDTSAQAAAMDKMRDSVKKQFPSPKNIVETNAKFDDKYPERDLAFDQAPFGVVRIRIIATPKKAYFLIVAGQKSFVDAEGKKFLESLKLKN